MAHLLLLLLLPFSSPFFTATYVDGTRVSPSREFHPSFSLSTSPSPLRSLPVQTVGCRLAFFESPSHGIQLDDSKLFFFFTTIRNHRLDSNRQVTSRMRIIFWIFEYVCSCSFIRIQRWMKFEKDLFGIGGGCGFYSIIDNGRIVSNIVSRRFFLGGLIDRGVILSERCN